MRHDFSQNNRMACCRCGHPWSVEAEAERCPNGGDPLADNPHLSDLQRAQVKALRYAMHLKPHMSRADPDLVKAYVAGYMAKANEPAKV